MQMKHQPTAFTRAVGVRIWQLRRQKGLSREKVAFKANISAQTLKRMEYGGPCVIDYYEFVAYALGVPSLYLFCGKLPEDSEKTSLMKSIYVMQQYSFSFNDLIQLFTAFKVSDIDETDSIQEE